MNKRCVVRLSDQEREHLENLVRTGRGATRAISLTPASCSRPMPMDLTSLDRRGRIAEAFEVSTEMVARERRCYCEEGL